FCRGRMVGAVLAWAARAFLASLVESTAKSLSCPCGRFHWASARCSFEAAPIGSGSGPGVLVKSRAERAGLGKAELDPNLRHRHIGLRQEVFSLVDAARGQIPVRRLPK